MATRKTAAKAATPTVDTESAERQLVADACLEAANYERVRAAAYAAIGNASKSDHLNKLADQFEAKAAELSS